MILYTCVHGKAFGGLPAPLAHPCGRAAKALDDSGHTYDLEEVKGGSLKFWTWPAQILGALFPPRLRVLRGLS